PPPRPARPGNRRLLALFIGCTALAAVAIWAAADWANHSPWDPLPAPYYPSSPPFQPQPQPVAPSVLLDVTIYRSVFQGAGAARGSRIFQIDGSIYNAGLRDATVPTYRAILFGADNTAIHSWTFRPNQQFLAAGQSLSFSTTSTVPA